jgi:site-specific recombinase XerD
MTVRVEQGKGGKDRYLPLSERLLEQLRQYWQQHPPGEWLWAGEKVRGPLHITTAQKIYGWAKELAGVRKKGGIHALRHAYATHLLEAGHDVHTVQRLLGHRFITSTIRYFHLSRARLAATRSPYDLLDPSQS